ncbi:carbon-nitrogen hydrolase family protein [uncultured Maritalea sp.]|jgi:predicted amidohydrolase|uniref:carbon-nitrogen hydrolase family protein n=1 Tax=uncultured Maritalea sp. TaxID=757249 RepID=UPI00263588D5|nr:carbon-nitrogen hydrolase family protein [uncultured Maritalea sp.]
MLLGAFQMCSSMDATENLRAIEGACAKAHEQGVTYLQVPEMAVMFAENHDGLQRFVANGLDVALAQLGEMAKTYQLYLHVGSVAVGSDSGKCLNRAFLFAPDGTQKAYYDKIHLFDADVAGDAPYRESKNFDAGERAVVADVAGVGLGMAICYDVRFPQLFATLRQAGAQILTVPAAFTVPTGKAHWESLLRARAIETGCYLVAAAQGGDHANGRKTYGHSMIVDPWGKIVATCGDGGNGLIVAPFDAEQVKEARSRIPTLANQRHFSLSVNHNAAQ